MNSRISVCAALVLSLSGSIAETRPRDDCRQIRCFEAEQEAQLLESKLRQGHSNNAGRRYRDQLRRLRDFRRKFCRG